MIEHFDLIRRCRGGYLLIILYCNVMIVPNEVPPHLQGPAEDLVQSLTLYLHDVRSGTVFGCEN